MKKLTAHHVLTPKGGRVASRRLVRPTKKITSRCTPAASTPGITPAWMRRTRTRGAGLSLGG